MIANRYTISSLVTAIFLTVTSCVSGLPINTSYPSKNFGSRVQYLILHFTAGDFSSSLEELTNGKVSSHYLVNNDPPEIYRLVDDVHRAFHAGESYWNGATGLNYSSIGIEIVNNGCTIISGNMKCAEYPKKQMDLVLGLLKKIVVEHGIAPNHILGHSDIAPGRKLDPGPAFPWKRLADEGLIFWPSQNAVTVKKTRFVGNVPDPSWFQHRIADMGYKMPSKPAFDSEMTSTIQAIQMKYRPAKCDGLPDAETAAIIEVLANR